MARSGGMMKFPDPAILVTIFFKNYEIPSYLRFLGLTLNPSLNGSTSL